MLKSQITRLKVKLFMISDLWWNYMPFLSKHQHSIKCQGLWKNQYTILIKIVIFFDFQYILEQSFKRLGEKSNWLSFFFMMRNFTPPEVSHGDYCKVWDVYIRFYTSFIKLWFYLMCWLSAVKTWYWNWITRSIRAGHHVSFESIGKNYQLQYI